VISSRRGILFETRGMIPMTGDSADKKDLPV